MFGHDDKKEDKKDSQDDNVVQPMSTTPPDENLLGVNDAPTVADPDPDEDEDISKIVDDINSSNDKPQTTTEDSPIVPPLEDETPAPEPDTSTDEVAPQQSVASDGPDELPSPVTNDETPSDLVEIKKGALKELSPLLDELDKTPEEKLNILMMTIQASDDQSLIPQAFDTAKKIDNKKTRAEAMLNIINEINYFTKKAS